MLAADKLQLQSALKQQATALKEKEFQLHHTNLSKSNVKIESFSLCLHSCEAFALYLLQLNAIILF